MTEALFETERLFARKLEAGDIPALFEVYGDADAMRYVGDGSAITMAECVEWVEVTHRNYAARGYGMFALCDKASAKVLGFAGIVHPGSQPEPEVKYALRRSAWGRGLATEAVRGLLAYGGSLGLKRIIATVHEHNGPSQRVMEKCGLLFVERDGTTLVYASG